MRPSRFRLLGTPGNATIRERKLAIVTRTPASKLARAVATHFPAHSPQGEESPPAQAVFAESSPDTLVSAPRRPHLNPRSTAPHNTGYRAWTCHVRRCEDLVPGSSFLPLRPSLQTAALLCHSVTTTRCNALQRVVPCRPEHHTDRLRANAPKRCGGSSTVPLGSIVGRAKGPPLCTLAPSTPLYSPGLLFGSYKRASALADMLLWRTLRPCP